MSVVMSFGGSGVDARYLLRGLSVVARHPIGRKLTVDKLRILLFLYGEPGGSASLTRVAKMLRLGASSLTRAGDALAELGLIERSDGPNDRRVVILTLTEPGFDLCERIAGIFASQP